MRPFVLIVTPVLAALVWGCGGGPAAGSPFQSNSTDDGGTADGAHDFGDGGGLFDGALGGDAGDGGLNGCATDHASATQAPGYLVFIMDRSDSMGQLSKWTSCSAALEAFFSDPSAAGLNASLTFLPFVSGGNFSCNASDYATPEVPMTPRRAK